MLLSSPMAETQQLWNTAKKSIIDVRDVFIRLSYHRALNSTPDPA